MDICLEHIRVATRKMDSYERKQKLDSIYRQALKKDIDLSFTANEAVSSYHTSSDDFSKFVFENNYVRVEDLPNQHKEIEESNDKVNIAMTGNLKPLSDFGTNLKYITFSVLDDA